MFTATIQQPHLCLLAKSNAASGRCACGKACSHYAVTPSHAVSAQGLRQQGQNTEVLILIAGGGSLLESGGHSTAATCFVNVAVALLNCICMCCGMKQWLLCPRPKQMANSFCHQGVRADRSLKHAVGRTTGLDGRARCVSKWCVLYGQGARR
jgi:hypothetical protein